MPDEKYTTLSPYADLARLQARERELVKEISATRVELSLTLRAMGMSLRRIGEQIGVTQQRVGQIVRGK